MEILFDFFCLRLIMHKLLQIQVDQQSE